MTVKGDNARTVRGDNVRTVSAVAACIAVVVGVGVSWGVFSQTLQNNTNALDRLSVTLDDLAESLGDTRERVSRLEGIVGGGS